jgi:hypothetical protein
MTKIRVWRAPAIERRIIRNKGHRILKGIQDRDREVPEMMKIRVWRAAQRKTLEINIRGGTSEEEEEGGQEIKISRASKK